MGTVEELFRSGGKSVIPMEAKVQVLWGKTYMMFLVGHDPRGCRSIAGAWELYGDKTGWDLHGMLNDGKHPDPINKAFLENSFDLVTRYAESFATGIGEDYTRVDFFLGST